MVFSSPVFLFLFLPLVLAVYLALPRRFWNAWLLLTSLFFYAWGEKEFTLVMLASIAGNYTFGILVDVLRNRPAALRATMALAVAANLALLISYKYTNLLADTWNAATAHFGVRPVHLDPVHLPIGISFFTFHALSYVVDVFRGHARAQRDPVKLALYITLFPQLIAGPILRFHDVADQITARVVTLAGFSAGVRRFIIGLAKKMLLANAVAGPADAIFGAPAGQLTAGAAWLGAACYTLQIYFDFSGYSDMAIGLGKMFGFTFPENFNYPYVSASIQEFWRRWHISLSTFFRDYVYIPLGGNRVTAARTYFNLALVFFLCGLWHGASWTFVIWGLYHGLFLILERLAHLRPGAMAGTRLPTSFRPLAHVYALLVVMVGWVFFRAATLGGALAFLKAMGCFSHPGADAVRAAPLLDREVILALVCGTLAATPLGATLARRAHAAFLQARPLARGTLETAQVSGLLALLAWCAAQLAAGTYNPFIYFRF